MVIESLSVSQPLAAESAGYSPVMNPVQPQPPSSFVSSIRDIPKKRVLLYSVCGLILTSSIIVINLLVNFLTDLSLNDNLWNYLAEKNKCFSANVTQDSLTFLNDSRRFPAPVNCSLQI